MTHRISHRYFSTGVSLIELTISLLLIGILASTSFLALGEYRARSSLERIAKELRANIVRSMVRASQEGRTLRIGVRPSQVLLIEGHAVIDSYELKNGAKLVSNLPEIVLSPSGVISPATIGVHGKGNSLCKVIISLRGRVRTTCES